MNEEKNMGQINLEKLHEIISEKDKQIDYLSKKVNLLQDENIAFYNQVVNFEKTFGSLPNISTIWKKDDVLYFLHIPKTAGTTLITILDNYFESNSVLKPHDWQLLLPQTPVEFIAL